MRKSEILENICYTELVYGRINKKLKSNFSRTAIERMIFQVINESTDDCFVKRGKNYYISNPIHNIRITINSYTYRVITVDRLSKVKSA